jgi:outer membrane protein TolC
MILSSNCKWMALIAACALLAPLASAQQPISLTDAIRRGLETNERYRIILAEQDRADARIKQARAGILPDVRFDGSYTRNFKISVNRILFNDEPMTVQFGTRHAASWGVSIDQSLWEGGRVFAAWAAARNYRSMTREMSAQARIDLEAEVAGAFFDALLARRLVEVAEKSLNLAEENYAMVDKKLDQGLVSEYDHLRAQVRTANLRPPLIQAQNNRQLADSRLRALTGVEAGVELDLQDSEPDSSGWESQPLDQLVADAGKRRHDVQEAEYEVRILRNGLQSANADYWPTLKLRGAFNWQVQTDRFKLRPADISRSWQGMLLLSYPLFDGFRRSGSVGLAKVDLSQAQLRRQALLKNITLEIEQARNNFLEATQRLEAQKETVAQAERGLQVANVRYESGVGTQLEVLDAQLELTTARIYAQNARHDRLVARAQWRRAMGEPVLTATGAE